MMRQMLDDADKRRIFGELVREEQGLANLCTSIKTGSDKPGQAPMPTAEQCYDLVAHLAQSKDAEDGKGTFSADIGV